MSHKKIALTVLLVFISAAAAFGQASALRDYVGIIDGTYHPDALAYFDKMKENYKKRGKSEVVKAIDDYIKMGFGTGFVYVVPDGANYVITNYHVVAQTNTLSVSFEKLDGAKTTYDRLKVVAADEDIDIAILSFADNVRPFKAGLAFAAGAAEEGSDVFAAGFPGLGNAQIWQFSKGVVSNGRMRFPRDPVEDAEVSEVRFGPFIQHTSPIDPGNSGGPLLVTQENVPTGYAVAGINSRSARYRSSTFYAIPADRALAYITDAIKPKTDAAKRQNLDARLEAFIKGLAKPKAVYGVIADYISNPCIASNAEYAILETFTRAPRTVQDAIDNVRDPVDAMKYCVAWLIEDTFRAKTTGTLRATLGEIKRNADGSYTVPLKFSGDREIITTWVSEFGIWKLEKAGDQVSGDKTLAEKVRKQRAQDKKNSSENNFLMLSVGYTDIFDHWAGDLGYSGSSYTPDEPLTYISPALDVSLLIGQGKYVLERLSLTLLAENFWQVDASVGFKVPIDIAKKVTLSPYAVIGFNIHGKEEGAFEFDFGLQVQGGLMLTTTWVPGLYVMAGYQNNFLGFSTLLSEHKATDVHMLKINVGYAFAF